MRRTLASLALLQLFAGGVLSALEVRGRVIDESGAPVVRAEVELHRVPARYERRRQLLEGRVHPEPEARVRTSEGGEYILAVPEAGFWQVEILADGKVPVRRRLLPLLEDLVLPEAVLAADTGIEVRSEGSDGSPLAGIQVRVRALRGESGEYSRRNPDWQDRGWYGLTDEEGNVRLSRRADDEVEVAAFAPGFMPSERVRAKGRAATVRLEPGRPMTLRFVTPSGEPVAPTIVLVGDYEWTSALTDTEGRAQFYLRPDESLDFGLITEAGQYETGNLQASLEELAQDPGGYEVLTLPEPVLLEGLVIEAEHRRAAPGAWVWTAGDPGDAVRTGPMGRYRLVRGSGRRWRIGAAKPGYLLALDLARREVETLQVPTLALVRAEALEGRVVDAQGEGVGAALVQAFPIDTSGSSILERPRTSTGADGRFRLSGLSEDRTYELLIEAHGFAPARPVIRPADGHPVEVVLGRGRTLTGRVVDSGGEPQVDAFIALAPMVSEWRWMHDISLLEESAYSSTSDADGRFRLEDLPGQSMGLIASKEGFAVTRLLDLDLAAADWEVDLGDLVLSRGWRLVGVVRTKDGEGIEGAQVKAQRTSPADMSLASVEWGEASQEPLATDADGRFVVENLARSDRVGITVKHPGFITHISPQLSATTDEPVEIVLEPAARVSGRVENERGRPVEGLKIEVSDKAAASGPRSGMFSQRLRRESVRSGDDGSFTLAQLLSGPVELSARGAGYIASEPVELVAVAGEELTGVLLRVRRGVELSGTVTDSRGRPVAGATVFVAREERTAYLFDTTHVASALSDAEGQYRIEGLDPHADGLALRVRHDDHPILERPLDLEEGSNRLDLVLEAGATVSGFVFGQEGEPVSGAAVGLENEPGRSSSERHTTLSTEDGSFEIAGVAAGTYRLNAVKEGYARSFAAEPVEVATDLDSRGNVLYLSPGGTLRGRILGVEPDEMAQIEVFANSTGGSPTLPVRGFVDPSGEYRIAHVGFAEGAVGASNRMTGQAVGESFDLDTAGGETWIDLEFRDGGSVLEGVVLFDGEPWRGAYVVAHSGTDSGGSAPTDGSGRFRILGLRNGVHRLQLFGEGSIAHTETVQVMGETEVTIEVTGARISGTVVDSATGQGISGATVVVRSETGFPFGPMLQAETSRSGQFEIVVPANQAVTLQARVDGYSQVPVSVDTGPGGEIAGVELDLERAAELELEVWLASGQRPSEVSVGIVDGSGLGAFSEQLFGTLEGAFRWRSVPPGDWLLLVAAAGGATVSVPVSVPGPPVRVTLPPEAPIRVDFSALGDEVGIGTLRVLTPGGERLRLPVMGQVLTEWPVMGSEAYLPGGPAGDWLVELVDGLGRVVRRQRVTTEAGETTQVTIR
jgi:protocatechuate 3,4-dioxygenase beta subunit